MTKIVIPDAAFGGPQAPTEWDKLMDPARKALEALIAKGDEMADRIEELEAKLAKAVEGFEKLARLGNGDRYGNSDGNVIAQRYIAELTGGKDE